MEGWMGANACEAAKQRVKGARGFQSPLRQWRTNGAWLASDWNYGEPCRRAPLIGKREAWLVIGAALTHIQAVDVGSSILPKMGAGW